MRRLSHRDRDTVVQASTGTDRIEAIWVTNHMQVVFVPTLIEYSSDHARG
eukprot:SAG31_NODE_6675_length_1930_cov_2.353905_2_plen_50_part_00